MFRVYDVPARVPAPHETRSSQEGNEAATRRSSSWSSSDDVESDDTKAARPPPDALWPAPRSRGESARDVAWLPTMCAHDEHVSVRQRVQVSAVHLWSAVDGTVAASYGKTHLDEPIDFTSLCFSRDGSRVRRAVSGAIRTWDLTRPGYHDVRTFWTGVFKGGSKRSAARRDGMNECALTTTAARRRVGIVRGAVSTMAWRARVRRDGARHRRGRRRWRRRPVPPGHGRDADAFPTRRMRGGAAKRRGGSLVPCVRTCTPRVPRRGGDVLGRSYAPTGNGCVFDASRVELDQPEDRFRRRAVWKALLAAGRMAFSAYDLQNGAKLADGLPPRQRR